MAARRKRRKPGGFSLRGRLAGLFLVLQLPLCLMQFYFYHWSNASISRELQATASSYVTFLQEQFDDMVDNTVLQQEFLLTSQNVNAFLASAPNLSQADYYFRLKDIMQEMQSALYANSVLSALNLYFPTLRQGVSVTSGNLDYPLYSTDSQPHVSGRTFTITDAQYDALVARQQARAPLLAFDGANFILTYGKSLASTGPYLVAEAVWNNEALRTSLNAFNTYQDACTLLTHWDSRTVVGSSKALDASGQQLPEAFFRSTSGEVLQTELEYNGRTWYALYAASDTMRMSFIRLIDQAQLSAIPTRLRQMLTVFYVLLAAAVIIYTGSTQRFFARPVHNLMDCFSSIGRGQLDVRAEPSSTWEFNELSEGFNAMTGQLQQLIQKDYENTILLQQATLKQMQAQIQPHFLYNSFFMLRHTIATEDLDKAASLCDYLGEYFQYITRQEQDFLPLANEWAHMANYAAIQGLRFQERLETRLEPLSGDMGRRSVPRLVLQPLMENVFTHGMSAERTVIHVAFRMEGDDLLVTVEDNGGALTDEDIDGLNRQLADATRASGSHALGNIHQRLRLIYGPGYGLTLSRSALGGLCVTMRLHPPLTPLDEAEIMTARPKEA